MHITSHFDIKHAFFLRNSLKWSLILVKKLKMIAGFSNTNFTKMIAHSSRKMIDHSRLEFQTSLTSLKWSIILVEKVCTCNPGPLTPPPSDYVMYDPLLSELNTAKDSCTNGNFHGKIMLEVNELLAQQQTAS